MFGNTKNPEMIRRGLVVAAAALVASCSTGGQTASPEEIVTCRSAGCPCIFVHDCDGDLVCVDGKCTADDPFAELLGGGDLRGQEVGPVGEDGSSQGDGLLPGEVVPQGFGQPCSGNEHCLSGWCVDAPDGGYCSVTCDQGCPEGWSCKTISQTAPDYIEICVLDLARLCLPCEIDLHCGEEGDLCLEIGGGRFCGRDCTAEPCPTGYTCTELTVEDGAVKQCLPLNGPCDCDADGAGQVRSCQQSNEWGVCLGEELCDPQLGWVQCTAALPAAEECDGLDNNCSGQVDEEFDPSPCVVENEWGTCKGTRTCQGASGWVCSALTPAAELCNGLDDNCNAKVDEEFVDGAGLYLEVEHCGTCGNSCLAKFEGAAEVACVVVLGQPSCQVVACQKGFVLYNELTCLDEDSFLCQPCKSDGDCWGELSKCLPVSDTDPRTFCARDCSGLGQFSTECPEGYSCLEVEAAKLCMPDNGSCDCTLDNAGQTKACAVENVLGICFGMESCDPLLGWTGCTAKIPTAEECNGEDDNCNGLVDEGSVAETPCQAANDFGICPGLLFCAGKKGIQCSAPEPAAELCDGKDNDCNGSVDDGFATAVGEPPVLKYGLSVDHCGACGYQCPPVLHGEPTCDAVPAVPGCVVGDCDDGYYNYAGKSCLPVPVTNLCKPCLQDSDCQGPSDRCLEADGGQPGYCGRDCSPGGIYDSPVTPCTAQTDSQGCCPDGFLCQDVGAGSLQCQPTSGSCSCIEEGKIEGCKVTNQFGSCPGIRTCHLGGATPGWTECQAATPGAELCDGVDNDCDGLIDGLDDSLLLSTTPTGNGQCSNGPACPGLWKCLAQQWTCDATPSFPELCDGLDNDCSGAADEEFLVNGLYATTDHCGACGYNCSALVPNSLAVDCVLVKGSPTCVALACAPGHFPFAGGVACMALPANLCQPCSSDADCLVPSSYCLSFDQESFCGRDCSKGGPYGPDCPVGYSCLSIEGKAQCVPVSKSCVCDKETVGLSRSCTVDKCVGQQTCTAMANGYAFTLCTAEGVVPEVCDGQDNDCDSQIDEGFVNPLGLYDSDEDCGVCGNDCTVQVSLAVHHAKAGCNVLSSPPECHVVSCAVEEELGSLFEWVDVNGVLDDGCECRRLQGNLDQDDPDRDFFLPGELVPSYPGVSAPYVDANCDGVDGVIGDALFVSAANPLPGDGAIDNPFQSVGDAVAAFAGSGKEYILVAGGLYEENIVLTAGLQLHGGYAPDFLSRNIVLFTTELRGIEPNWNNPAKVSGTVHGQGIVKAAPAVLSGFTVTGYQVTAVNPAGPGYSSYALHLVDCDDSVVAVNNRLIGGKGGPGSAGTAGATGYGAQSGVKAVNGGNGSNAGACTAGTCSGQSVGGGSAGANSVCAAANGSKGGGVTCPIFNQPAYTPALPGHDGSAGWNWTFDSKSSANCYSHATEAGYPVAIKKMDGGHGADGVDGADGLQGAGCAATSGAFLNGEWVGAAAATGAGASPGQGGGAGGSSGGLDSAGAALMPPGVSPATYKQYKLGATGGGGGAAGCGGAGGSSGRSAGGSLAALIGYSAGSPAASLPLVRANRIVRGMGGKGGSGGYGGVGGAGGKGGSGGTSSGYWVDFRAGAGGRGGSGGTGGGGGGGCGGASFGLALFNHSPAWPVTVESANSFETDAAVATGGAGGAPGLSGVVNPLGPGKQGTSANFHEIPAAP